MTLFSDTELSEYTVQVETPKGSFLKKNELGDVDFVSPVPSPFNYGSILGIRGADGDLMDAIILGRRLEEGTVEQMFVLGRVVFIDAGFQDDKWIFSKDGQLGRREYLKMETFFRVYAMCKRWKGRIYRTSCNSHYLGIDRERFIF